MWVGIPVIPCSRGVTDGAGGARYHDLNTDHAVTDGSVGVAGVAGQVGSLVVIAITAGSLAGSHASSPPATLDQ